MPEITKKETKVEVKPIVPKLPKRKLTLEERVARLEKFRFGVEKPYA